MRCQLEHGLYPNPSRSEPPRGGWTEDPAGRRIALDGELGSGGGEEAGHLGSAGIERRGQSRFGLRQALAATGPDPQFASQVAQGIGAILHRGPDVSV